jgi:exopolysaccharide production protein ExoQ
MLRKGERNHFRPLLCFYFVVFTSSFYSLFSTFDSAGLESAKAGESPIYLGLLLLVYGTMLFQLVRVRTVTFSILASSGALFLFVCSSFASYIAAGAADISVQRFILYLLTIGLGLLIASRYSINEVCETFFYTSMILIAVHFLMYPFLAGKINYDPIGRATLVGATSYAGLFSHKSAAAVVFALSLIVSLVRFLGSRESLAKRLSAINACCLAIAIAMAGAVGPLISVTLGLTLTGLLSALLRGKIVHAIVFFSAMAIFSIMALTAGMDGLLSVFGRTQDLTGRRELFTLWPLFFWQRPLLGYGFNGFFNGLPGGPADYLSELVSDHGKYATFESTYLEILLEFGIVGGTLFCYILIRAALNAGRFCRSNRSLYGVVPLAIITYILIGSISDSGLIQQNFIVPAIVFWIYFGVDNASRRSPAASSCQIKPAPASGFVRRFPQDDNR